ncbi:oxidoreductase, partial [Mycobacterium tuberculosis]|nr:oxidoreductase [Mycobacterium tuberculosis]
LDTALAAGAKDDPAEVARLGFDAMMREQSGIVTGLKNRALAAVAAVTPATVLAHRHRLMAEPGSATRH